MAIPPSCSRAARGSPPTRSRGSPERHDREDTPMIDTRTAAYGALILRVALGGLLIAHFALKYFVFTPAGTAQFFGSIGLPPALAYLTMLAELVAGPGVALGAGAGPGARA